MKLLPFSRPTTAIKRGENLVVGFGFPGLAYSRNIRELSELRALVKSNPAVMRNVTAHYLRVCGLNTREIGKFLDISPSRVSAVCSKGWIALYPTRPRRSDYRQKPSYLRTTAQTERKRWLSRLPSLRALYPRTEEELVAHLIQQATEEIVDAEAALANFTGFDDRRMVAAAFAQGRSQFARRTQQLTAACICAQCDSLRAQEHARLEEASEEGE